MAGSAVPCSSNVGAVNPALTVSALGKGVTRGTCPEASATTACTLAPVEAAHKAASPPRDSPYKPARSPRIPGKVRAAAMSSLPELAAGSACQADCGAASEQTGLGCGAG